MILSKVMNLLESNKEEQALLFLYTSLIDNLNNPEVCDEFLKSCLSQQLPPDVIAHSFNALSPIKDKLLYWDQFYQHSIQLLKKDFGEEEINDILKVII